MMNLLTATLLSIAMVGLNHYFPWIPLFRKGKPALIMYSSHLACLLIPLSLLLFNWRTLQILDNNAVPVARNWFAAIWILAIVDLITEFVCIVLDNYITMRYTADLASDENDSLKADLLTEEPEQD